jgi:hypothetical protein
MISFRHFIVESEHHEVHYFDVDKTLMHTDATKVHVKDENGKHVESLDPQQFNHHKLKSEHSYDFSEFKSADKFKKAKPIRRMMKKMRDLHKSGKKVEILTARSDFDDQKKFAAKWKKHKVDISKGKIHVRRAGNIPLPPHDAKAKIISDAIKKNGHKVVHLYDDHKANIDAMLALKKDHPDVEFHGHHVQHGSDGKITVTHYKA